MSADIQLILDHGGASVSDLERSITFYCDVLGFEVEERFAIPNSPVTGAVLGNGGAARVELFHRPDSAPSAAGHPVESTMQQGWFQLAFRVASVVEIKEPAQPG